MSAGVADARRRASFGIAAAARAA